MIHNHWLSMISRDSQPLAQHNKPWFTTNLHSIIHHDSQPLGLAYHTMIHNHWLRITHYDSQPMSQHYTPWLTTTLISISQHDSQPLVQYNTPWFTPLAHDNSPRFTTTCSELHTMINKYWLTITHHNSQPLAQHNSPWLKTTGSA